MQKVKRMRLTHRRQLEDVPELIHHIQALLPPKDAARTCVLSKSWLHAWSTTPTLRFCAGKSLTKQQERRYLRLIRRTIRRYHRDNIPIITCDIHFGIRKPKSATRAEKFIMRVASKSSLKALILTVVDDFASIDFASFTLPDEIFSCENLNTLSIKLDFFFLSKHLIKNYTLRISSNPLIVCVNLRVLELLDVHIDHEEMLHNLLSTCKLLEKINLRLFEALDNIKVNNLLYLHELKIAPGSPCDDTRFEICNVPRLCSLSYDAEMIYFMPELSITDSIGSLREIHLSGVIIDDYTLCDIINKFPILESLTLDIRRCKVEILDIRSNSLQRLTIVLHQYSGKEIVQVNAPKLLSFRYKGCAMPSLLFPTIAPEQIELTLWVNRPIDHLVFLKLREYLNLSSKFNIVIRSLEDSVLSFNIDNVRTRVLFPATNVEKLLFETFLDDGLVKNSVLLFDALFSICRPLYVEAHLQMRLKAADYFLKLIDMGVTENKSGNWPGLKSCEIRTGLEGEWEMLTSSSLSLVGEWSQCVFKLAYCSP